MAFRRLNCFAGFFAERFSIASVCLLLLPLLLLPSISCIAAAAAAAGLQSSAENLQSTLQRIPLSSPAASFIEPMTQSSVGNISPSKKKEKIKSFENSADSKETSEVEKQGQMSKVTSPEESGNTASAVDRNGTLSVEAENQTTVYSSTNGSGEVRAKVKVKSDSKQTTEKTTTCCAALTSDQPTTEASAADAYNYNEYDNDINNNNNNDDDDEDDDDDDENDRDEVETDDNYERNVYGYNDSSDGKQAPGDYREEETEEDPAAEAAKPEYIYSTDNVTSNETEIPSNQDQQDLNSDPNYYYHQEAASAGDVVDWRASGPSADRVGNGGHSFGGSPPEYEAGSRDYHFGTKHRSFDMYLGQKISEMRSGSFHGRQSLSLRWLEHRQINHFAIFLWLVAALATVGIAITAYRFRHSVYNAIQSTRTNYKQGRRIGIEEANDLLSHAQV